MSGAPAASLAAPGARPSSQGWLDRGAIVAGWVGLGMAVVIAMAFELIFAVQPLVFLAAPLAGGLIGAYANVRSARWRPAWRVFVNSGYAALVTGTSLALIYGALRLLFVFTDSGYRGPDQGGQLECRTGPECTYLRYVAFGVGPDLATAGVTDGDSFGGFAIREQAAGAGIIVVLTLGGAMIAAAARSLGSAPEAQPA